MRNTSAFQPNIAGGTTKAYYTLNGNSTDFSSNGYTGTDTAVTYPKGRFGQGAKFNGSTSKIQTTAFKFEDGVPYTISFWAALNTKYTTDGERQFISLGNVTNHTSLRLFFKRTTSVDYITWARRREGTANDEIDYAFSPKVGQFNHYLLTWDGSNVRGYLNGQYVVIKSSSGNGASGEQSLFGIGADVSKNTFYVDAIIDEVIVETRVWTAKEVETYYRKSMLNYTQKSLAQMVFTYTSELLKGTYTQTGKNLDVLRNYVGTLLKGAYDLAGKNLDVSRGYVATLGAGIYNLVGKVIRVPNAWTGRTKHSSTWTNESKNSSTWSNEGRNSSTWTKRNKN